MPLKFKSLYPQIRILQSALKNNISIISDLVANESVKILVPIKANAYGCGLEQIIFFLENCKRVEYIGVANPKEGIRSRECGYSKKILLLGSFFIDSLDEIVSNKIIPTITDVEHIHVLEEFSKKHNITLDVHLKCDLGMGRLGITRDKINESIYKLQNTSQVNLIGLYTHFPSSERVGCVDMLHQIQEFDEIFEKYVHLLDLKSSHVLKHAANSQACILYPQTHYNMVRTGLMFYGYFPMMLEKKNQEVRIPILPSIELYASPISIRTLRRGDRISYGSTYIVQEKSLSVGVLPLGYADGINRKLANRITFDGYPLVGNVTMDQIILANIHSNREVQLLGAKSSSLEYWAELSDTTTYELLTHFGERLERILI